MENSKKPLWITLISIDVVLTLGLFVLSIIMLATMPKTAIDWKALEHKPNPNFIEFLQLNRTLYFCVGVLPLILLLIANFVGIVLYFKKGMAKRKIAMADLSDEQKEALRKELLEDLNKKE